MVEKDLQKEIGGVKTDSKRALECERPFVETAALAKRYLKRENAARKDDIEALIEKIREVVRQ